MANFFLLFITLLITANLRLYSAAQPPSSAPTLPPPVAIPSISTPPPFPTTIPPSLPPISINPPPPLPSSPPPATTITPPPPPPPPILSSPPPPIITNNPRPQPQQIQLNNIIDALIGAGDFAGWANILSNTNPSSLPLSATFFIPRNTAVSSLPTSTASGAINFDPFIIPYHIIPQRLSFSDLLLFKPDTRLPTLLPTKTILITDNSPTNFTVDDSPITHPDMYINSAVSVHGVGKILDYTIYGGNPFQPPIQQTLDPPLEASGGRSDSASVFANYRLCFSVICALLAFNIEIGLFNKAKIAFILCALCFSTTAHGMSSESCVVAYNDGGAPAVFQSLECSQWVRLANSFKHHTGTCDLATLQGHREYQEDRVTCNLGIKIPFLGREGVKEAKLDVLAIFDGHGGAQASGMANQKLLDYFLIHVVFRAFKEAVLNVDQHDLNPESPPRVLSVTDDESFHDILKEALLHAIHDIDMEFSVEAFKKQYHAGSTATVVLLLNGEEMLVASLGDSPALLCKGSSTRKLRAAKLTRNHHPDEEDERARIEAAGGFVRVWGVPRVNGILAVSRAIGDVSLKRFGVIAVPEVKGWQNLTLKDRYLVITSDGIFEGLTPDDVCNLIQEGGTCTSSSLSDSIVETALKNGSMDNLSAIVLPLTQSTRSQPSKEEL